MGRPVGAHGDCIVKALERGRFGLPVSEHLEGGLIARFPTPVGACSNHGIVKRHLVLEKCPVCGAKASMNARKNLKEQFNPPGYPPVKISGLQGQFCDACGEGFWSLKSEQRIAQRLAEHMAEHDAHRIVVAELASVQEAANAMKITVQGVHKMMKEGRLRYVVAGGCRLPIRKDVTEKARKRQRARAQ